VCLFALHRPSHKHPRKKQKPNQAPASHTKDPIRADLSQTQLIQLCGLLLPQQLPNCVDSRESSPRLQVATQLLQHMCSLLPGASSPVFSKDTISTDTGSASEALLARLAQLPLCPPVSDRTTSEGQQHLTTDGEENEDEEALKAARVLHEEGMRVLSQKAKRHHADHEQDNEFRLRLEGGGPTREAQDTQPPIESRESEGSQRIRWRVYDGPWQTCAIGRLPCGLDPSGRPCPLADPLKTTFFDAEP